MATKFVSTLKPEKKQKKRGELDPKETAAFLSRPVQKLEDLNRKLRKSYQKDFFNKPQFQHFKILKDKRLNKDNDSIKSQEDNDDSDFEVGENTARGRMNRSRRKDSYEDDQAPKRRRPGRPPRQKVEAEVNVPQKKDLAAASVPRDKDKKQQSKQSDTTNSKDHQQPKQGKKQARTKKARKAEQPKQSQQSSDTQSDQSQGSESSRSSSGSSNSQSEQSEQKPKSDQSSSQSNQTEQNETLQNGLLKQKQKQVQTSKQKLEIAKNVINHTTLTVNITPNKQSVSQQQVKKQPQTKKQHTAGQKQSQSEEYYHPMKQKEAQQKPNNLHHELKVQKIEPILVVNTVNTVKNELKQDELQSQSSSQRSLSSEGSLDSRIKQRIAEAEAQKQKIVEKGGKKCTRVYRRHPKPSESVQKKSLSPSQAIKIAGKLMQTLQQENTATKTLPASKAAKPNKQPQTKIQPSSEIPQRQNLKRSYEQYVNTNVKPKLQIKARTVTQCFIFRVTNQPLNQLQLLKEQMKKINHFFQHSPCCHLYTPNHDRLILKRIVESPQAEQSPSLNKQSSELKQNNNSTNDNHQTSESRQQAKIDKKSATDPKKPAPVQKTKTKQFRQKGLVHKMQHK